jgi:hypothetical protein
VAYDPTPMLSAWRAVIADVTNSIDAAIPDPPSHLAIAAGDDASGMPVPLRKLARSWAQVKTGLDDIDASFAPIGDELFAIMTDSTRSQTYIAAQKQAALTRFRVEVAQASTAVCAKATALLDQAARAALPQRPGPQDAAQEARLAGLKSDLQLLVSNVAASDIDQFTQRLSDELSEALAAGDALTLWLLAGSGWTDKLIKSRSADDASLTLASSRWELAVNDILAGDDTDAAQLRKAYRALAHPTQGVPALLVACGQYLLQVAEDATDARMPLTGR